MPYAGGFREHWELRQWEDVRCVSPWEGSKRSPATAQAAPSFALGPSKKHT